jgi:hypothetical protein
VKPAFVLGLIALGLLGRYHQVEGAGWVLFIGLLSALFGDIFP